jgi:hypothetical protein
MYPMIDYSTSCEIRAIICFLHTKNMSTVETHYELCALCRQNVMSEGTIRQWCRMFKDGLRNINDEEQSRQPSVGNDLVQSVDNNL